MKIMRLYFDKEYNYKKIVSSINNNKKFKLFFNRIYEDIPVYRVSNLKDGTHYYAQMLKDHIFLTYISQDNFNNLYKKLKKYIMKGLK